MSDEDDFQSSFPYNNPILTPNPHSFNKPKLSLNPNSLNPNSKTSHLFSKPYLKGLSESTIDRFLLDSVEEKDTNCYLSNSIEPTVDMEFGRRVLKEKGKRCYFPDSVESRLLNSVDPIGDFADKSDRADMEFSRGVLKENVKRFNFSNSIESKLLKSVEPLGVSDKKMVCSGSDIESGSKVLNEKGKKCYLSNSVESRLLKSGVFYGNGERDDKLVCSGSELESGSKVLNEKGKKYCSSNSLESRLINSEDHFGDFDDGLGTYSNLDVLLKLCDEGGNEVSSDTRVFCPLCRVDISYLPHKLREEHTNDCLDNDETPNQVLSQNDNAPVPGPGQVVDVSPTKSLGDISPVIEWLRGLNLAKYEEIFAHEEIDWDTLQWLTEDDLLAIGISALGPRKKIVHALSELRKGNSKTAETRTNASSVVIEDSSAANKLITDFFPGFNNEKRKESLSKESHKVDKSHLHSDRNKTVVRKSRERKLRDIPQWCCIPGTPFRVDAFKYLRSDCSYWFLTHFHIDHYQGLARSFSHGKLYCSLITAKLVNIKIGIPWERLQILPLNQKINIAGIDVTCFDANHCPGAIILLFEPPSAKAVLHTGDFRYSQDMTDIPVLQTCRIQTLVLDTTYCNPQFDFPKQEAVIQFVIEAIQAEAFNQTTLFLIGSYTIGKERLFLEVARVLRRKVYVGAAKLRILECLGIPMEDMQWFTSNEQESHIHVVPMWTLASFKRLKCISNQYSRQYSLIVAFSPTGWTFGKGKKKSTGRRWQQGTIVRYEVPYSEHSSFTELQEFVKFISPQNIIPSVNNDGPESANAMVSLLLS